MRSTVRSRRVIPVVVAVASVLAGCSGQSGDAAPSPSSSSSRSTTPSPSRLVTPTATDSATATSTPTASPSRPPGLVGRLLPATAVPELARGVGWAAVSTGPESPSSSFGTCQRFSTLAIGAERALVRRYRPARATGDRAGELVAELPDALTAHRASAVLTAWRGRCADRLKRYRSVDVGAQRDVAVPQGTAAWYLLGYGPVPCPHSCPSRQYADAQGMVVVGHRLAMVSLRTGGSPASVTRAMPTALRSAARLLQ